MKNIFRTICFLLISYRSFAQSLQPADTAKYKIVIAGPEYKRSAWHQFLWGTNYRREWATPVSVPILFLDTTKGGLTPYKAAGGHQTKSLHIKTAGDKEYALRSVNKTLSKVLPGTIRGAFIEKLVNDEVSMSDPYGAAAVPLMAEKANIYHTYPVYVYLPKQPALDTFNDKFGSALYLFEQKPEGNWKDADNLGNFEKFYSTDEVLGKMQENNQQQIDQRAFVRARIFDWFLGDWDRHEGQWAWGERKMGDAVMYVPVPQDRDQVFSKHNGVLLNFSMSAAGLFYMQPFADNLKNVTTFTYEERNLDRFFTNEMVLSDWQDIAKDLQRLLTDEVIEASVKQLPPEIFAVSGNDIISKLKSRRSHLVEWATTYYLFIAKEIQVTGSKQKEQFEIKRLNDDETSVNVYSLSKKGDKNDSPFYSRTFKTNETKEVRLFGLSGEDAYTIEGKANGGVTVRIIGGDNKDSILDGSGGGKVYVYDDDKNFIRRSSATRLRLSNDTSIHSFKYAWYKYDKKGIKPSIFHSTEDRIYVGLGYQYTHYKWRKEPFGSKQFFDVHYSISQKAFSVNYSALFPQLIGKADLAFKANYDVLRWKHFFGFGNEAPFVVNDIKYYTTSTEEWIVQPGIIRKSGMNTITLSGFFQAVRVINDTGMFISKSFAGSNAKFFQWNTFSGAGINYKFQQVNDSTIPTKGFIFSADATAIQNLKQSSKSFVKYAGSIQLYIPLISKFSFVLRTGAATVTGSPEFYQYASIGGPTLRGYRRDRFWGKTAFYNTNELRFISKTHLINCRAGLIAFFDDGRVWMPNENSNTLHTGYGGGLILSPFKGILADVTYGISKEDKLIQIHISKYF